MKSESMQRRQQVNDKRKNSDPFLEDILADNDKWQLMMFQGCNVPQIECRDRKGNLYTVYLNKSDAGIQEFVVRKND